MNYRTAMSAALAAFLLAGCGGAATVSTSAPASSAAASVAASSAPAVSSGASASTAASAAASASTPASAAPSGSASASSGAASAAPSGAASKPAAPPPPSVSVAPISSPSPELKQLIDAANKEGQLSFVWNNGLVMGPGSADAWAAAMNKLYGTNIKITYTPGAPIPDMAAKTAEEVKAGRPTTTDVLITDPFPLLQQLIPQGTPQQVDWSWAPSLKDTTLVAPGNYGVEFVDLMSGITYNANKLKGDAVPKTMADLLKPEFKGKVASTAAAIHFIELSAPELWGEQKTVDYATKFASQIAGFINCAEISRIASGEFDVFAIDCGSSVADAFKARGAPVGEVVPTDAPVYTPLYMTIPKTSAHPNAAKLWINFVLSPAGQELLYKETFGDAVLPGSHTAALVDSVQKSGAKPVKADIQFYQRNDATKMVQVGTRLIDIFKSTTK